MRTRKREKVKHKKHHDEGTWAISYGDMLTLLLGFFILFFSMEPPQKGNAMLTESLIETMRKLDDNLVVTMNSASGEDQSSQQMGSENQRDKKAISYGETPDADASFVRNDEDKEEVNLGSDEGKYAGDGTATDKYNKGLFDTVWTVFFGDSQEPYLKTDKKAKHDSKKQEKIKLSAKDLDKSGGVLDKFKVGDESEATDGGLRKNIIHLKALNAEAEQIGDKIVIKFPNISFFNTASTELTDSGVDAIDKFGKIFMPFVGQSKLNIIGFSDNRPVKSGYRFKDNLELSVLRAVSVQRNLERMGIPLSHTRLAGYGVKDKLLEEEKPKSKSEMLALSRKVVLVIEPAGE
jgi:flagellar motor protein MotB